MTVLRQLARFGIVGALGAAGFVGLSTATVPLVARDTAWVVSMASYVAMIGPVYLAHRRFSFESSAPHRQALPRYVAVQVCASAIAAALAYLIFTYFSLSAFLSSVLVSAFTAILTFVVLRVWAFSTGVKGGNDAPVG